MSVASKSRCNSSSSSGDVVSLGTSQSQQQYSGGGSSFGQHETIQLLVDNSTFVVNPEIFAYKKDTMLYRMFFSSPSIAKPNDKGQYVIEGFSSIVFGAILVCLITLRS